MNPPSPLDDFDIPPLDFEDEPPSPDVKDEPLSSQTQQPEKEHRRVPLPGGMTYDELDDDCKNKRLRPPQLSPTHDLRPEPSTSSATPTEEREHWRVRLRRIPFPGGRTAEDMDAISSDDKKPPRVQLLRRSQRLEDKNPEQFVLRPPYYGQDPPGQDPPKRAPKPRKPRKNPNAQNAPMQNDPRVFFTPEEKIEMQQDLVKYTGPKPKRQKAPEPEQSYTVYRMLAHPPTMPQYPLLTRVTEATLAAIGMGVRKGEDGHMWADPKN